MFELISAIFVYGSILFATATILLALKSLYSVYFSEISELFCVFLVIIVYSLIATIYYLPMLEVLLSNSVFVLCFAAVYFHNNNHSPIGLLFYTTNVLLTLTALLWSTLYISGLEVSTITKSLMFVTLPLLVLTLPFSIIQMIEQYDVLCRKNWRRPKGPKTASSNDFNPLVSLHVPTYAEPPEMVIDTLNKIAELSYSNFEVLVVDNNTKDESLWRPIAEHCKKLGPQFRFFHVDPLSGAKAGALNFALAQTHPEATIIGIIDADYHTDPNFISHLIGHFENPNVGFVQTPHDYRNWETNTYLEMCYWEYKAFFHTILVALNEKTAALTIGTMCLLRKSVVEEVGGWATWCVTEDSELAIRIHDSGYSSVYIPITYGRGLIPDRFVDYAKQRYRWIAGPVQELRHHFWRYVQKRSTQSKLTLNQRLHHFNHGFGSTMFSLQFPLLIVAILLACSMFIQKEIIEVPFTLWLSVTTLLFTHIILQWLQYKTLIHATVRQMFLAILAHKALTFTVHSAALRTTWNTSQPWQRTNKFVVKQKVTSALASTYIETIISICLISFTLILYVSLPHAGMHTMCLIGIAFKGFEYLCTPIAALISVFSQSKTQHTYPNKFTPQIVMTNNLASVGR